MGEQDEHARTAVAEAPATGAARSVHWAQCNTIQHPQSQQHAPHQLVTATCRHALATSRCAAAQRLTAVHCCSSSTSVASMQCLQECGHC